MFTKGKDYVGKTFYRCDGEAIVTLQITAQEGDKLLTNSFEWQRVYVADLNRGEYGWYEDAREAVSARIKTIEDFVKGRLDEISKLHKLLSTLK